MRGERRVRNPTDRSTSSSRGPWEQSQAGQPNRGALRELVHHSRAMSPERRVSTRLSRTTLGSRDGQRPRDWRGRLMLRFSWVPGGRNQRRPSRSSLVATRPTTSLRSTVGHAPRRQGVASGAHCYRGSRRRGSGSPKKLVSSYTAGCMHGIPTLHNLREIIIPLAGGVTEGK